MVSCPKCDASIDVEEEELDEGDVLSCDECGASLTVASVNPVELASEDDKGEEVEDFDFDEDEDEGEEEDEKEDEEDWH
jgi:alpha-aminoadipate/glutamate carrier protein LysW